MHTSNARPLQVVASNSQATSLAQVVPFSEPQPRWISFEQEWSKFEPPVLSGQQLEECERYIEHYKRGLEGGSPVVVGQKLLEASVIFADKQTTPEQAEARVMVYAKQLSDVPADILVKAFDKAFNELRFFPTIAEIRERADALLIPRRAKLHRLQWTANENRARLRERQEAEERAERKASAEKVESVLAASAATLTDKKRGYVPDPDNPPPGYDKEAWAELLAKAKEGKQ